MKTIIKLMPIVLLAFAIIGFSSCEKKNLDSASNGKLEISLNLSDQLGQLKSASTDSTIIKDSAVMISFQVMISVETMDGKPVITDKLIPLYNFGSGFVSEQIEIPSGELKLTKFMVIDPSGRVVFAAPVAGSPLAYLVNKPLPFNFVINPNVVTRVLPEVLEVNNQPPDQFGYATFGVQVVKPLIFYTICILDNPLSMAPTQITQAKLTVYANNGWHYSFKLEAFVNRLIIRGGSETYTFVLEKEGYMPQKLQIFARELLATTRENPLVLKIPWDSNAYKTLILQPGPELGKDAMISNIEPEKNFGLHKYFEATFSSEPILTVMRVNRSLIWFDMNQLPKSAIIKKVTLKLSYDVPVPWDSTIYTTKPANSGIAWYGAVLQQIVDPWEEASVTWNKQPKSIETNQVYLSPFIKNANFIEIDVSRLYMQVSTTDQLQLPNYGMMFKLWPEENFPGFRFASSDYATSTMRPALIIQYTVPIPL
jgi:hypothetical protein